MSEDPKTPPPAGGLTQFWQELKRRKVMRVGTVYAVVGWLLIQIASTTFENFGIPIWAFRFVTLMVVLGFPISLILTWAFELTPDGITATKSAATTNQANTADTAHQKKRNRMAYLIGAAVPTLIFGILVVVFYFQSGKSDRPQTAEADDHSLSIAVLPLLNMSAVEDNAYFAGGVHEDILTNLSRIVGLRVTSRTSAMRYVNTDMHLSDIGKELNVRYVVEGSVRRVANHVRVTVQLIDSSNDAHLWANNYDRELVDVFATQSAVAKEISNSLHLAIQPETVGKLDDMPTHSVKAYDLYLKAKSVDRIEQETIESIEQQIQLLEQAVAIDPDFVEAWGFLNEAYDHTLRNIDLFDWYGDDLAKQKALNDSLSVKTKQALNKAIALGPENLETLLAMASDYIAEKDFNFRVERKRTLDRALELYPNDGILWYVVAWWYKLDGQDAAASNAFKKALDLDPLHARIVSGALLHFRDTEEVEMAELLFDRLDKSLGKANVQQKVDAYLFAYHSTADESYLTAMSEVIQSTPRDQFSFKGEKSSLEHYLIYLRYDSDFLENPPYELALSDNAKSPEWRHFRVWVENGIIRYLRDNKPNEARRLAQKILDFEFDQGSRSYLDSMTALAYWAKGDIHKTKAMSEHLLSQRSENYNSYGLIGFFILSLFDSNKAATLFLEEKAHHPTWTGTDDAAVNHLLHRNILIQPKVMEFYRKEGKWWNHLKKRIPEYREYAE